MSDAQQGLDDVVAGLMNQFGVPGVAVGVWCDSQETIAGYGVTNVEHPLAVDGDTLFQIGSTSKTFTATLAMMLAEEGKLDLDRPILAYLPAFQMQDAEVTARATLRHCFTHTGGWLGDYFDDTGDGDGANARYVERMAELPQLTPLGEVWSYNNAGFGLAGRVIEVVADQPYEQVVQERIFSPLDMDHSFYFAKDVITHRVAVGHNARTVVQGRQHGRRRGRQLDARRPGRGQDRGARRRHHWTTIRLFDAPVAQLCHHRADQCKSGS
jgi:CubicO group peptidase (beta-lactamase class C family)